jgi:hypothetical protein
VRARSFTLSSLSPVSLLAELAKNVLYSFNRRAVGPNAFQNLLPAHKDTLVYLMARDQQSFPAEYMYRLLEDMRHHGLLVQGVTFHSESSYYSVPNEIWREMRRLKWPAGQVVPQQPPWIARNRDTVLRAPHKSDGHEVTSAITSSEAAAALKSLPGE